MRRLFVAAAVLLVLSFSSVARAQITDVTDDTIAPIPGAGHDYIHLLSETVNPANGSVSVNIGLPAPKGRGISLPFSITYNSGAAGHFTAGGGFIASQAPFTGGWGNSLPNLTLAYQSINFPYGDGQPGSPTETCYFTTGYMFTDVSGGSHALGLAAASLEPFSGGNCTQMGSNIPSFVPVNSGGDSQVQSIFTALCGQVGGNGPPPNTGCSYATPPLLVFDKAGTIYSFAPYGQLVMGWTGGYTVWPVSMEDRNGNIITFKMTNAGALTVTDTAGRTLVSLNGSNTNGYIPTVVSVGGLTYSLAYTNANIGYTPQTEALPPPDGVTNPPGLSCTQSSSGSATPKVLSSITLPNNQTYRFSYDPTYGTLSEIQYPDGGWVKYTWKLSDTYSENDLYAGIPESGPPLSESCNFLYKTPVVATREVGFTTSTTPVLTQTFTYNTNWNQTLSQNFEWTSKMTTVQTTDNVRNLVSQTAYTYWPVGAGPSGDPGFAGSPIIAGELAVEHQVQYNDWGASAPGPVIRAVVKTWADQFNLLSQETILDNNQTSEVTYQYGFGGAITQEQEYDFGSGAPGTLLRTTVNKYQTFAGNPLYTVDSQAPSPTLLTLPCQSIVYSGSATGTRVAETDYQYDGGTSVCGTAGTPSVTGVSGLPTGTHDETYYGPSTTTPAPRGNVTTLTTQCFPGCAVPSTTYTYDETGQVLSMKDPLHAVTQYSYADSYTSGTPPGNTNAYLTKVTRPTTNGVAHISNYSHAYIDGELTIAKDENGQSTDYAYSDSLDRLTSATYPDGGETTYTYNDAAPSVTTSKLLMTSGSLVTSEVIYDGMGHPISSELQTDPDGIDYTITTYDGVGQPLKVYNPTRCNPPTTNCGESTWGYTTYTLDVLSRAKQVVESDGSSVTTSYSGNTTTVTDEAGAQRKTQTDGLGRLQFVWEAPNTVNYPTSYTYDVLGNLLKVTQNGLLPRSFAYDSLSRLTSSTNPESNTTPTGTIVPTTYLYDVNGNLTSKTMPAQNQTGTATVTLSYCYDVLNRVTSKAYTAQSCPMASPVATYSYDGVTPSGCSPSLSNYGMAISRRTAMCDAAGLEAWSYDTMGRVLTDLRTTNTFTYSTVYAYLPYVDGSINSISYPSGTLLTYTTGGAERQLTVSDTSHSIVYASAAHYAPQGALSAITNQPGSTDTPVQSTYVYNSRLQPCWTYATSGTALASTTGCTGTDPGPGNMLDLKFNLHLGSTDNGNVVGITNNRDTTRSQSFTYDALNRIATAETASTYSTSPAHCWGEAYVYDNDTTTPGEFGNLTNINAASTSYNGCTQESLSVTASAQNRLSGYTYDTPGNLTAAPAPGTASYTYNAENQMTSATTALGTGSYLYDGDGKRVAKSSVTLYWYGANGNVLDETNSAGSMTTSNGFNEYVYFGGRRIARRTITSQGSNYSNIFYYFTDQLGTSRAIAQYLYGQTTPIMCYDADFYPFGGERVYMNTCAQNYKFTSKERDSESNLDNFGVRYDSSSMGRFMSADSGVDQHPENPQSWNLYTYALNNPLVWVDPSGEYVCGSGVTQAMCDNFQKSLDAAQNDADKLKATYGADSTEYKDAQRSIDVYGKENVDNGVTLVLGGVSAGASGDVDPNVGSVAPTKDNPLGQKITVHFNKDTFNGNDDDALNITHEGSHAADASDWVRSGFSSTMNPNLYNTENRAFHVEQSIAEASGYGPLGFYIGKSEVYIWQPGWTRDQTNAAIDSMLRDKKGLYRLNPNSKISTFKQNTKGNR